MAKKKVDQLSFEQLLSDLEGIATDLEKGDLPLEDALELFERGMTLSKESLDRLDAAELRIKHIMSESDVKAVSADTAANDEQQ